MKHSFIMVLLCFFVPQRIVYASSGQVTLQAAAVHAAVQGQLLLRDFNEQVGFVERIVPNHSYPVSQITHIVDRSLQEYQGRFPFIVFSCDGLRRQILRSLLREHPELLAAVLVH